MSEEKKEIGCLGMAGLGLLGLCLVGSIIYGFASTGAEGLATLIFFAFLAIVGYLYTKFREK